MAGDDILWKKVDELKQQEEGRKSPDAWRRKRISARRQPERKGSDKSRASKRSSSISSTDASNLARYHASMIEDIRRVVKQVGREASFVRLTAEEKRRLVDIVYSFKRQGVKTSENELLRVALNFLLDDYKDHGKESVLAKALEALHA